MATVDVLPTYDEALALIERWRQQPPTEDETNQFLEKAIVALEVPENIQEFKDTYQDLATSAVKTDEAFDRINRTLSTFATQYPEFTRLPTFHQDWEVYRNRWETLLTNSRRLASSAAINYAEYDAMLEIFVANIKTEQDVKEAVQVLQEFSKEEPPVYIPPDLSRDFLNLKRDIEAYQEPFFEYLDEQGAKVSAEVLRLKSELDALQKQLAANNKQVEDATLGLQIVSAFFLIGAIIAGTALGIVTAIRNAKQREVEAKQTEYDIANNKQAGLEYIKTGFDSLDQSFEVIIEGLGLFAQVWQDFHNEAGEFAEILDKLPGTELPRQFVLRVTLARKIATPLQDSLRLYASTIQVAKAG